MTEERKTERGFTLLELLVALAIFSIVMVSAVRNNATIIANAAYLEDRTLAHWVAMNKAAELRLARRWLPPEGAEGQVVMADRNWRWRIAVKATPDPDVQLVDIAVAEAGESEVERAPLSRLAVYLGRSAGI